MKFSSALVLLSLTTTLFGAEPEGNFEDLKKKMTERLDQSIGDLQEARACVKASANKEQIRSCRDKMQEKRTERKAKMFEQRLEKDKKPAPKGKKK